MEEDQKIMKRGSYFCKQITETGEICEESNPECFDSGRYSSCKECRKNKLRKYCRQKYEAKKIERNEEILTRIGNCLSTLENDKKKTEAFSHHIHDLVLDTLENYPLQTLGISLPIKITELETKMNDMKNNLFKEISILKHKVHLLETENRKLKNQQV